METTYDVIVVGAGTSGLMAAISAAEYGAKVLLIEKNKKAGKKLLMTGGGRCNVTNNRPVDDLIAHIPGNGKFLYSTFSQWNNFDIMEFFESQGVHLKEEDHGRMFPVTNKSKTIIEALIHRLNELNVTMLFGTRVEKLVHSDGKIYGVRTEFEEFQSSCVVLTTGGEPIRRLVLQVMAIKSLKKSVTLSLPCMQQNLHWFLKKLLSRIKPCKDYLYKIFL